MQVESKKQFYQVFQKNIRYFASNLEFWLIAVYYEFEVLRNPFKARSLFHQALAHNRQDPHVWAEYLLFELKFQVLMQKRDNIIGKVSRKSKANTEEGLEIEDEHSADNHSENDKADDNADIMMLEDSDDDKEDQEGQNLDAQGKSGAEEFSLIDFSKHEAIFNTIVQKIRYYVPTSFSACLKEATALFDEEAAHDPTITKALNELKTNILKAADNVGEDENIIRYESYQLLTPRWPGRRTT